MPASSRRRLLESPHAVRFAVADVERAIHADRATHDFTLTEPNGDSWPRVFNPNASPPSQQLSVWNPWSGEFWDLDYDEYPGSWVSGFSGTATVTEAASFAGRKMVAVVFGGIVMVKLQPCGLGSLGLPNHCFCFIRDNNLEEQH